MRCVIVTGMSGAGKSTALNVLEDDGYFCVDNLPVRLVDKFVDLASGGDSRFERIAIGIDIRSGKYLPDLVPVLQTLKDRQFAFEILFLDADDASLIKRFKETRRSHPLAREGRIEDGVREERIRLAFLKDRADYMIDTSQLLTRELKRSLEKIFVEETGRKGHKVTVVSFGFKFGIPSDADLVFDARFLPNPYYVDSLRALTGQDTPVKEYVLHSEAASVFLEKVTELLQFLIPQYIAEGRDQIVVAVGCTGGRHRSVAISEAVAGRLGGADGYQVKVSHRDIEHDNVRKQYDAGGKG